MRGVSVLLFTFALMSSCVPGKAEITPAEPDTRVPVETMKVETGDLPEKGSYFGSIEAKAAATISAEVGGKVLEVAVEEGDKVSPGQTIVKIDEEPLRLAEEQATRALEAARIRVEQIEANLEVQQASLEAQVDSTGAAVDGAKAKVSAVESGARAEEKRQASAAVEVARVARDNALLELERVQSLFKENAATKQSLDQAQSAYDSAIARYNQAIYARNLVYNGSRKEDKDAAKAQLKQAEAGRKASEAALGTLKVQEKELGAARVQIKTAELALENAKLNRSKTQITSIFPAEATVLTRYVEPGEMASPGMPLFELLDMSRPRLALRVPSTDVRFMKVGDNIPVNCFGDEPGRVRTGKVHYISMQANPQNTTFAVKIELDNDDSSLRVGQICEAHPTLKVHNYPLVPRDAVLDTPEGKVVVVVEEGVARERSVAIKAEREGLAALSEGLQAGEVIIVVGQRLVRDGEAVNVRAERPPARFDDKKTDKPGEAQSL